MNIQWLNDNKLYMIGCKQGILNSYCAFVLKQNILVAQ
jgi:hypothetical protein